MEKVIKNIAQDVRKMSKYTLNSRYILLKILNKQKTTKIYKKYQK